MTELDFDKVLQDKSYWKYYYIALIFDISVEEAEKNMVHKNGLITAATELAGDKCIKKFNLWEVLFPGFISVKKIKDKKLQKLGIDYTLVDKDGNTINVDLKCLIGESYTMDPAKDYIDIPPRSDLKKKGLTLEIDQKNKSGTWIFTNSGIKKTDYLLYIIMDKDGIFYYLLPFKEANKICMEYRPYYTINIEGKAVKTYINESSKYKVHLSNNKSGHFIKVPYDVIKIK